MALESLFEVEGESIGQDSIHALKLGPTMMKMMVVSYDNATAASLWITPGIGNRPMAIELDSRLLTHQTGTSGKSYLRFRGTQVLSKDVYLEQLTPRQREIYADWETETEKAGFGGAWI